MNICKRLLDKGSEIFLLPDEKYPAAEIVFGVNVNTGNKVETMYAIGKNTYRGFHRNDKSLPGPRKLIEEYIGFRLTGVINALQTITCKENYEYLSTKMTEELREQLKANVKGYMLKSYNKVRKPIDLLLEHLVAMSSELNKNRESLVPLLNVPLDSFILESEIIFNQYSRKELGIKQGMTYQDIESKSQYDEIQMHIQDKAKYLSSVYSKDFYPIYFDLIWSNRFERVGKNLFKTNP